VLGLRQLIGLRLIFCLTIFLLFFLLLLSLLALLALLLRLLFDFLSPAFLLLLLVCFQLLFASFLLFSCLSQLLLFNFFFVQIFLKFSSFSFFLSSQVDLLDSFSFLFFFYLSLFITLLKLMFQNSKAFNTRNELSEFEIATVGRGFFKGQDELMFGDEFLFAFGGIVVLVDLKVVNKCKESFHDEM
jgi:hypothetical protein